MLKMTFDYAQNDNNVNFLRNSLFNPEFINCRLCVFLTRP